MLLTHGKICIKCSIPQPATEFYYHRSMKDQRLNKCRTCTKKENSEWRDIPEKRAHWNEGRHRRKLFLKFGITPEIYDDLYRAPKCAGCGLTRSLDGKKLALDHDHKTGAMRGLLCRDCNQALGNARDDPSILRKLASYLEEGNPQMKTIEQTIANLPPTDFGF